MTAADEAIGRHVAAARAAVGMSQATLAELIGDEFYPQTVLKVEKGTRALKLAEAPRLAAALGVTVDGLLGGQTPVVRKGCQRCVSAERTLTVALEALRRGASA